jgi:hypothetical protein
VLQEGCIHKLSDKRNVVSVDSLILYFLMLLLDLYSSGSPLK